MDRERAVFPAYPLSLGRGEMPRGSFGWRRREETKSGRDTMQLLLAIPRIRIMRRTRAPHFRMRLYSPCPATRRIIDRDLQFPLVRRINPRTIREMDPHTLRRTDRKKNTRTIRNFSPRDASRVTRFVMSRRDPRYYYSRMKTRLKVKSTSRRGRERERTINSDS